MYYAPRMLIYYPGIPWNELVRSFASFIGTSNYRGVIFTTLLLKTIIIIWSPLKLLAQDSIGYYSPGTPPAGIKSFQPLMAKWWDFTGNQPNRIYNNWPICLKADVAVDNRSVVFLGDPASA